MADDYAKLAIQAMQFAANLNTVAETLRNCASIAETFATSLEQSKFVQGAAAGGLIPEQDAAAKGKKRKAGAFEEEPAKRKRKPRDPNAPKRPASSYIMFQNEIRKDLREKHPNLTNSELLAMIARLWAEMPEEDKAVYHNAVASAKEQYSQEKKAYDARSPEEVAAANAATAAALASKKAAPRSRAPKAAAQQTPPAAAPEPKAAAPTPSSEASESSGAESSDEEEVKGKANDEESDTSSEEEEQAPVTKRPRSTKAFAAPPPKDKKKKSGKA